jgi:hypothetical protein
MWEEDWRGVDQSDGEREKFESSKVLKCGSDGDEDESKGGDQGSEIGEIADANVEHPTSNAEHRTRRAESVHGESGLGAADPGGAEDVREPVVPRAAGLRQRARFRQTELF